MEALLNRSRRRKIDVVPLVSVAPVPPEENNNVVPTVGRRVSRVQPMNAIEEHAELPTPSVTFPSVKPAHRLNSFAHSVISMNRQQHGLSESVREGDDNVNGDRDGDERTVTNQEDEEAPPVHDPWSDVLGKVMRKTFIRSATIGKGIVAAPSSPNSKRVSLTDMLKRRDVKDLVKQAIVTQHWSEKAAARNRPASPESAQRSSVMEHWMKTSVLRNPNPLLHGGNDAGTNMDDDDEAEDGIKSGFDVRDTPGGFMYGRTLLLEESCRRAFALTGENRSQMDLQALKAWFQLTKLKITTDFERLQPTELDLLCRRMELVFMHTNEVVFRQGDEGDALYILFAGSVEVRVAQRILGEKVEVTVCELTKGDYFGERALLHDEARAATIVAKTPCELVRITRKDYNIMLKQDQQEFFSRMQLAGSVQSNSTAATMAGTKSSLLLSRSLGRQQTQREYVNVLSKKKHSRTKADIDMLSEYLHTLKFFRGLPKTFVRELCGVVDFLTLPPSSYVFKEGEVGDLFYIIFSGSVDVIVSSKDIRGNAQQTKLINLTEGAHFGELALMKGHGIRSATVLTREETKFLVICEKDYNATLRRMQKEDLAKRVGVLDRIPMFQTPEWTGDLLKEMSYVLSEQKLATGAVLFRQGEKALQLYFVVRGELLVTKEIVDPVSSQTHVVFVERIGRDRVVGDEAAAGSNFNEVIYREITVTASTPVELLVLSKYDVFHRLSRAARETLRAAAHCHVESVVYLDRFHKTAKWDAYKQRLLKEHLNVDRMRKLLPNIKPTNTTKIASTPRVKPRKSGKAAASEPPESETTATAPNGPTRKSSGVVADGADGGITEQAKAPHEAHAIAAGQSELVNANEFLLLDPLNIATSNCFPPTERSLTTHVSTFNADAPPRVQTRERQLKSAFTTERRREVEMLNEGNPLSYFDLETVQTQQRRQQVEVRGRAASSRRLLLRESPTAPVVATPTATGPGVKGGGFTTPESTNRTAMNQFFQENFIFSPPKKPVESRRKKHQRRQLLKDLAHRHGLESQDGIDGDDESTSRKRKNANETAVVSPDVVAELSEIEAVRKRAEQHCIGDIVVVDIEQPEGYNDPQAVSGSPGFRIVCCSDSLEAAKANAHLYRKSDGELEDGDVSALYALPKQKFALMPRATRPRVTEEAQQRAVIGRFLRTSAPSAEKPANQNQAMDPMSIFASFQKLSMVHSPQLDASITTVEEQHSTEGLGKKGPSHELKMFASVSIVLSKRELETAFCDEPFLCVHALYPTEAEAMESALLMPMQALKNALLCILPVGEWVRFDEAYDWCVQIETDRRDKHPAPPTGSTSSSPPSSPGRRKTGSICGLPGIAVDSASRADWEVEREKAQRLHQFICTRMGLNKNQERDRRNGTSDTALTTGFTPRPTVTLEDKLATLQDYLDTTSHAPLGGKSGHVHVSMLGKYRNLKRFGSIMRSRIGAASPPSSSASTSLTGVVPGGNATS